MEVPPEVVEEAAGGVPVVRRQDAGRGKEVMAVDGDVRRLRSERPGARRATAQASSRSEPARRTSGPPVPTSSGALRRSRPRWTNCVPWPGKYRVDIVPQCRCHRQADATDRQRVVGPLLGLGAGEPLRPPPAQLRRLVEFGVVDIEGRAQPLTVGVDSALGSPAHPEIPLHRARHRQAGQAGRGDVGGAGRPPPSPSGRRWSRRRRRRRRPRPVRPRRPRSPAAGRRRAPPRASACGPSRRSPRVLLSRLPPMT